MITVGLETAKKLKELGWSKSTYFYISENNQPVPGLALYNKKVRFPAPTAQELLDVLPTKVFVDTKRYEIKFDIFDFGADKIYGGVQYKADFLHRGNPRYLIGTEYSKNLANALAELRIRCKENGYLDSKDTDE